MLPLAVVPNPALSHLQQPVPASRVRLGDWLLHSDGRTLFRVKSVLTLPRHTYLCFHLQDPIHFRPWHEVILVHPYRPATHLSPF